MTRILELIVAAVVVVAIFLLVGVFLPSDRMMRHSVETNRPMPIVFDTLNSFARFKDWNPIRQHDPNVVYTLSGPVSGVGARLSYVSEDPKIGSGSWEITESVPEERIVIRVENPAYGHDKEVVFTFRKTGQRRQNVEITQTYSVEYGWDLPGRYAGMYVARTVGDDLKRGLGNFGNFMATVPRYDYSRLENAPRVVEFTPANVLVAPTRVPRTNEDITTGISNNLQWIEKVMEANNLERAAPIRLVTNELSGEAYDFDLVVPVRRKGSGPALPEAEAAPEGEIGEFVAVEEEGPFEGPLSPAVVDVDLSAPAAATPAAAPAALPDLGEIKLEGPVQFQAGWTGRAVATRYVGHPAGLSAVRDTLRAWAIVRGYETFDRPVDEYLETTDEDSVDTSFSGEADFNAYWPIR